MFALTPEGRALVDRLEQLTRERIAPRAAEYDAAAQNPVESWRDLWREGFLAAAIPVAHGGLGLDMPTYIAAIRIIARGCARWSGSGSTAGSRAASTPPTSCRTPTWT